MKVVKIPNICNHVPKPESQFIPICEQNKKEKKKYKKNKNKHTIKNNWKVKKNPFGQQHFNNYFFSNYGRCNLLYYQQQDNSPCYYFPIHDPAFPSNNIQHNFCNHYNFKTYMENMPKFQFNWN